MSTSSRVVKNTLFLDIRLGVSLFVSLYSTRLILASLGEVDFGIFNVIGGSIAMMGFLNSTLANATQRFMSYAEGVGDQQNKKIIFNVSVALHVAIAVLTIIMLMAFMPLLFNDLLNIPIERIGTAKIVYYTLILSSALTIINVPYDAVMNAHENMLYYAIVGIVESLLKLGIALLCVRYIGDRLILYSALMMAIPIVTLTAMKIYCHKHYGECELSLKKHWDLVIAKRIAKFSGWNFLTAISSLATVQGLSVVLNHFFGTILNAAQGIATQVNGQLSTLSANLMKALNPVIVKRTANSDSEGISTVTYSGSKFSTLIILAFAVPLVIKMKYILSIWLKDVPDWTVIFCQLQLLHTVIVQLGGPSATAIYGKGDIKCYAIWKSLMNIMPLLLSVIAFHFKGSPIWLYLSLIIFMGVGGDVVIVHYANKKCNLSAKTFITSVIVPIVLTMFTMGLFGLISILIFPAENLLCALLCGIATTLGLILALSTFGLTKTEKSTVLNLLSKIKITFMK